MALLVCRSDRWLRYRTHQGCELIMPDLPKTVDQRHIGFVVINE